MSVIEKALKILKTREFVSMATAEKSGKPNSAPKLLLKIEGKIVYFIDYSIGKTAENLKANPEASLSFFDIDSLIGYRLNGKVSIIEKGVLYDECLKELAKKQVELSVERVVKAVHDGKAHKEFGLEVPERFLIYRIKIEEGCEVSPRGEIKRENS
jgi:predicted pyridoxine 5'-phosphate oxidase superfamily flavin-nucleotide-binding protein